MLAALLSTLPLLLASPDDALLTVAESSDYRATSTHDEIMSLARQLDERSTIVTLSEMGRTEDGRVIPLLILADPPVRSPADVDRSQRLVAFALGNIHGGEVCGKEALMMLAREVALSADHPLLDDLILLIAPIYNADGNDAIDLDNRPGQVGPAEGMGERANANGLDLNRDFVKIESAEGRALVRVLDDWDPEISIDTHTTNGSRHRYTLTYDSPLHPSSPPEQVAFLREELLPEVTRRLRERTGYETFFYGNFNREHTVWATYSPHPRFGANYQGLRGQMTILSEAYSYASYRDRVLCTLEFVREILGYAAEHRDRIRLLHDESRQRTIEAGRRPQPSDLIGLRHRSAAFPRPVTVLGYDVGEDADPEQARDHRVVHLGRFEAVLSVPRPAGYVISNDLEHVVEVLRRHGVEVEPHAGPTRVDEYMVRGIRRSRRPFQGHRLLTLDVEARDAEVDVPPGSWLVRTAQPLGTLIVCMLEPQSDDGLAAWNFLDDHLTEGEPYPILRVSRPSDLPDP